jgi:peptidoglycan/LPS O-acetylase OafA/YrhL
MPGSQPRLIDVLAIALVVIIVAACIWEASRNVRVIGFRKYARYALFLALATFVASATARSNSPSSPRWWAFVTLCAVVAVPLGLSIYVEQRREKRRRCGFCGHKLQGSDETECPTCGTQVDASNRRSRD